MRKNIKLTTIIPKNQCGKRLDQTVANLFPNFSRSQIKKWILSQFIAVNNKINNQPKNKVFGGEILVINTVDIERSNIFIAQNIPLNILYEDNDIIIINKPRNLVVHPGAGNPHGTILNALLYHYPTISEIPRAGIVHRLDKNTTGLMVVAKTMFAQIRLLESLKLHKIIREYEAIVVGRIINSGTINQPISRHNTKRTHMSVNPKGKSAITHYHIIEHFRMHTRLKICLETGRTHQIRVHMAHIAHPIVGDYNYGGKKCFKLPKKASKIYTTFLKKFDRQALHATTLRLYHPISGVEMEWNAPLPHDMIRLIEIMREDFKEHTVNNTNYNYN